MSGDSSGTRAELDSGTSFAHRQAGIFFLGASHRTGDVDEERAVRTAEASTLRTGDVDIVREAGSVRRRMHAEGKSSIVPELVLVYHDRVVTPSNASLQMCTSL